MRKITASRNELPGKKPGSQIAFGIDRTFGRFFQFFPDGEEPTVDEDHLTQTEMFSLMKQYGKPSGALNSALDDIMLDLDPATGKEYPFNWVRSRDRDRQFDRHAALEIDEADMKKLHDGEEVEISGQKITYKQASQALRWASALGLAFEDAARFLSFKEARFSEGPKGRKEFDAWMKKQPKSFQDDWEQNKEELESGGELAFEEGMMEKSGPAMVAEEVDEAFSQSRSNSYVTDVVREVAEEACGEYMSEDEDDVFGRMASLFSSKQRLSSAEEMSKKAFAPDSVDGWLEWESDKTAAALPQPGDVFEAVSNYLDIAGMGQYNDSMTIRFFVQPDGSASVMKGNQPMTHKGGQLTPKDVESLFRRGSSRGLGVNYSLSDPKIVRRGRLA